LYTTPSTVILLDVREILEKLAEVCNEAVAAIVKLELTATPAEPLINTGFNLLTTKSAEVGVPPIVV